MSPPATRSRRHAYAGADDVIDVSLIHTSDLSPARGDAGLRAWPAVAIGAAFYARLGWECWRGPLSVRVGARLVPTPDEEVMALRLPRTPTPLDLSLPLAVSWRLGDVW